MSWSPAIQLNKQMVRFSNECQKTDTKVIAPSNHNKSKHHDESLRIPSNYCNLLKAREKSPIQGAACFGFAPHWSRKKKTGKKFLSQ